MVKASISDWGWFKRPGAHFENGLLVKGEQEPQWYFPAQQQREILNDLFKISDERTAVEFARYRGLLGLNIESKREARKSAFDIITVRNEGILEASQIDEWEERIRHETLPGPPGDSLSSILYFVHKVKLISEVRRIQHLYDEDVTAGEYEANSWVNDSSNVNAIKEYDLVPLDLLKDQFQRGGYGADLNKYILDSIISSERRQFSYSKSFWVELKLNSVYLPNGHDEFKFMLSFSSLSKFIEYTALASNTISPRICADPKCGQIFFPQKSDQRYCPPPPGIKRSRCEGRHSQENKRERQNIK
jgi:hypothetical protein